MQLKTEEQELAMWMCGVIISNRIDRGYSFVLVQLYSFYVELIYRVGSSQLQGFHPFDNTDNLDPYLPKVKIEFL